MAMRRGSVLGSSRMEAARHTFVREHSQRVQIPVWSSLRVLWSGTKWRWSTVCQSWTEKRV